MLHAQQAARLPGCPAGQLTAIATCSRMQPCICRAEAKASVQADSWWPAPKKAGHATCEEPLRCAAELVAPLWLEAGVATAQLCFMVEGRCHVAPGSRAGRAKMQRLKKGSARC